jgi:site-specific DNA recombinase
VPAWPCDAICRAAPSFNHPTTGSTLERMALTGREYLRVSQDRSGRARSVEEQHDDNLRAGQQFGFSINGEAYSDVSLSASRYATKVRGGFARLMADLEAGRFGADLLVLWESSRGSRRVGEWASLVDKLEDAGVKVHVTTHSRTYDPSNARDRRSLMEDAVDAEYASGKASDAIRRAAAATAARGEPHGRVPFGYKRIYDPETRRLVAQEREPAEAAVVEELFTRLRQGHSLRAIAYDFKERGIRTRHCPDDCKRDHQHRPGKLFDAQHLRDLALRPIYAQLRMHTPGNRNGRYQGSLDGAVKAKWPALVDAETFYAVRALLQDPSRRTSRPGRGKHLLSLIAVCGPCGGWLTASYRSGSREYQCRDKSCVRIDADGLDVYAERIMLAYLARPDVIAGLRQAPERDSELARLRASLAEARSELASLQAAGRAGKVSVGTLLAVEPGLVARVEALEARERELITPPALSVIPPGRDVARRWKAAPMSARRQVARLLLSPEILGTLRVVRSPTPGHRTKPEDRVTWDPQGLGKPVD